jgi:hypothetical protein
MELSHDMSLKIKFEGLRLPEFWTYIRKEQWGLSQVASEVSLFLETKYIWEKHFR